MFINSLLARRPTVGDESWNDRASFLDRSVECATRRPGHGSSDVAQLARGVSPSPPPVVARRAACPCPRAPRPGALFLHTTREQLGDDAFWNGVKRYTQEHAGKVVESRDFQRAIESASGKDLGPLFRAWVGDDA